MKKISLICLFAFIALNIYANYFKNLPYTITQPNGEVINCFVSGDEFFNWLHDKDGYTIIQADDGYYYYAEKKNGVIVSTTHKVNKVVPSVVGLTKWTKISAESYSSRRQALSAPEIPISPAPHSGTINNIVVYIRFSDDIEFTTPRQTFDDKLNPSTGNSLKSYYQEVSYNQLTINSTHYPACALNTNFSYQDTHARGYFEPYNATTNNIGYSGGDNGSERTSREHTLLKDAINWINANSSVPAGLNIDGDNDGRVDNVCFIIKGISGAWNVLLWAHRWSLYSFPVYINEKRVYDYTFQPETQVDVQTLCHEMFHSLGAPDLYHYSQDGISPASSWDLMESGFGHMGAYMKWRYSNNTWISSIPEITASGTYTLNPLTSSTNNCYKIASPNSINQFYILEYRKKESETFENNVPGSGLLVYRINPTLDGNADGPPDGVYIYRPNGTVTSNGSPSTAFFSSESGRISINDGTNPTCFLQDGSPGGLDIFNISSAGNTISFSVNLSTIEDPFNFISASISNSQINLQWQKNTSNNNTLLIYNTSPTIGFPVNGSSYSVGSSIPGGGTVLASGAATTFNHTGLQTGTNYYYKLVSNASGNEYSSGAFQNAATLCSDVTSFPFSENFTAGVQPSCWNQVDYEGNGQIWQFGTTDETTNPNLTGNYAYLNSDNYGGESSQNADLISPVFNFKNYTNIVLSFKHYYLHNAGVSPSSATLSYSNDNGLTWAALQTWTVSSLNPATFSQNLTTQVAGYSQVLFKWNYTGTYDWYWAIDDISLTANNTVGFNTLVAHVSLSNGEYNCWNALENITVAGPSYSVILQDGSESNFIAGQSINFMPGFHAQSGSQMNAYITQTGVYCSSLFSSPPPPAKEKSIAIVDEENVTKELVLEKTIKVYPNPNNGKFTLQLSNFEGVSNVTISNTLGAVIYRSIIQNTGIKQLEFNSIRKGMYIVTVTNGEIIKTNKIIIN